MIGIRERIGLAGNEIGREKQSAFYFRCSVALPRGVSLLQIKINTDLQD